MLITLAYFHGGDTIQHRLIRWWTASCFSHVELFDPTTCVCWSSSSKDGGVREKYIDLTNGRWTIVQYDFPFETDPIKWFLEHEGCEYSWNSILNYVWYSFTELPNEFNCSVAIAQALGFQITRITPQELYEFLYPHRVQTITFEDGIMKVTGLGFPSSYSLRSSS